MLANLRPILFLKALEPGERWITVHGNGPDSKGQPILIQPQPDGSAKVIGGAGGSLNHLRLTGVKPQGDYKETIKARADERRERAKAQVARDKALGIHESKAEAQRKVSAKTNEAQRDFISGVADAMGWDKGDLTFDEAAVADQPPAVAAKLRKAHHGDLLKRATEAVKLNRARLLADASARDEAEIGEIPLTADDAATLSVQDLDPVRTGSVGLGFAPDYKGRAEDNGAGAEEIEGEAAALATPKTDAQRKAAIANGETAKMVRENLDLVRDPDKAAALEPKLVEAKRALELLKLDKKRKLIEAAARAERKNISETPEEPKAFVVEVDDAEVDKAVAEQVDNDLRTLSTRAFLSEVAKTSDNPAEALGRHIASGAFNSVNALALAAGGDALVDRSVVDVLGVAGAAEVLARRLQSDLSPDEFEQVAEGMSDFHLNHYMAASSEAIARARELKDHAAEIELTTAENGDDLTALQEINRRRGEAIRESQRVLGTALGEMEANAALVLAMKGGKSNKPFEVSLGDVATESALTQIRAIGLERGDYTLEKVAGNRILTVLPHGLARLSKPVNRADLEQVRRNLDIIEGRHDEQDWLPLGVSDRPDLDMSVKPGVMPSFAKPFDTAGGLEQGMRDYIGGRAADGDTPADILSDMQTADFLRKAGDVGAYNELLDKLAPLKDETGKRRQAEALRSSFEAMADEYTSRLGIDRAPLHRQTFDVDEHAVDALHRALAAEPTGVAAYKPVGELTPQDQGALREHFAKHIARESAEEGAMRHELAGMASQEPEREIEDMFGEKTTNPDWSDWKGRRDSLSERVNAASMTWPKYVQAMRTPERAYAAVQDVVRSGVSKGFADAYNRLNPAKALKVGRATIRDNLNHLDAVDPQAREARLAKERALTDSLRERAAGRYAAGSVRDKLDTAREAQASDEASQLGFFADEPEPEVERELAKDERHTIGHEAERKIAEMMPAVGANFKPGQPVKMFRPTMSGGNNWARQRAVKLIAANKRAILSFGTGSGKTLITLGAFTHLREQGKAKRGLFLVPSIAQGGFHADALRFLDPGKFKWHAQPGASREDRIAAYKDPSNDFAVMTHQSFRDDMVHLGAQHAGVSEADMGAAVAKMGRTERKAWLTGVMRREGMSFDYLATDEAHNTLDRKGKEDSMLANVVDAASDSSPYFVSASADPVKNDVSEAFSLLQKMDPERYQDEGAFMRKYGVDTLAAKDSLRREMARFQYPSKIDPDITANKVERPLAMSDGQKAALGDLDKHIAAARIARMQGKVDVDAMRAISPSSFEGVADTEAEGVARDLQTSLGILKEAATKRIIYEHPTSAALDEISAQATARKGKQGVVFAHSLNAVKAIHDRLASEGHRVGMITGGDGAKDKARKIAAFNPGSGAADYDVLVCSDAGATGANLQSGQYLIQHDTPDTAMTHAQRQGRINRIGQTQNVDLIDLVPDHPSVRKSRDRLTRKYALRDALTTPMESLDDTGVGYFLRQKKIAQENGGLL